jgi:hypothetical protein
MFDVVIPTLPEPANSVKHLFERGGPKWRRGEGDLTDRNR